MQVSVKLNPFTLIKKSNSEFKKRSIFIITTLISQNSLLYLPSSRHQFLRCSLNVPGNLLPQSFCTGYLLWLQIFSFSYSHGSFLYLRIFAETLPPWQVLLLAPTWQHSYSLVACLAFSHGICDPAYYIEFIYLKTFNVCFCPS